MNIRFSKTSTIILLLCTLGAASALIFTLARAQKQQAIEQNAKTPVAEVLITTYPDGAEVKLNAPCMGGGDIVQTPYLCKLNKTNAQQGIIIEAPRSHQISGYTFKAWEGCTANGTEQWLCPVTMAENKIAQTRAVYEKEPTVVIKNTPTPAPTPTAPNNPCNTFNIETGSVTCIVALDKYSNKKQLSILFETDTTAYRSLSWVTMYCTKLNACPGLSNYITNTQTTIPLSQVDKFENSLNIYASRSLTTCDCDYNPPQDFSFPLGPTKSFEFISVRAEAENTDSPKLIFSYKEKK